MEDRTEWTFDQYWAEIRHLSETIGEFGAEARRDMLLNEMWRKFPQECLLAGISQYHRN